MTKVKTTGLKLSAILTEMKEVPVDRLEGLYQLVHSLTLKTNQKESVRKKIISFGGASSDMNNEDYSDFLNQTKQERADF